MLCIMNISVYKVLIVDSLITFTQELIQLQKSIYYNYQLLFS